MAYFDGFVLAVPTDNKDKFIAHAELGDAVFRDEGAVRIVEAWGDDVPRGETTDYYRAVAATDGETPVYSWIEWPDKAARDAAMARSEQWMKDPRMDPENNPMPFDGKRMIFGGFDAIVDERGEGGAAYVDGAITPVGEDKREAYRAHSAAIAPVFIARGASRYLEAWGDDVAEGKLTDFRRAVKAGPGEVPAFAFIEWPDKPTRDAAWAEIMADDSLMPQGETPFDGRRMFWGGFVPVVTLEG